MGAANRGTLAGYARGISERRDLLAAIEGVGRSWNLDRRLAAAAGDARRARFAEMGGDVCRRQFRAGEKRGSCVGKTKCGKGTKRMVLVELQGIPVGALVASASPAEVKLLEPTLETVRLPDRRGRLRRVDPPRVIADRAYDSDPLRERLAERQVQLIAPNRRNRRRRSADGRTLRRYRRRWTVERTFAWLSNFRRLVTRWDRLVILYRAFFHVACLLITARHL